MSVRIILSSPDRVEAAVSDLEAGSIVVVCGLDGEQCTLTARRVTGHRTAVYVGDLDDEADRAAAKSFASEMFGHLEGSAVEVLR